MASVKLVSGKLLRHLLLFAGYGLLGVIVTLTVVFLVHLEGRPDLQLWHTVELEEEFAAESDIADLEAYLRLEDRLFGQLERLVYDKTGPAGDDLSNRYKRDSLTNPSLWPVNWNRTFEFTDDSPRAVVLLLHGLSDSPYSMRSIGLGLNRAGAYVLGLRIPGHGTAPSALVTSRWPDMVAAVRLAMVSMAKRFPDQPIYIVGYSNGAALALKYVIESIGDKQLPEVERLVLLSPEIGVTPLARFAVWQARIGHLLGLDKVAWNDIHPEYDPFKYGSFAVNAGDTSFRITKEIRSGIDSLRQQGLISRMPPILAVTSVVDATVRAPDLITHLMDKLDPGGHQLVMYDVNRRAGLDSLYQVQPDAMFDAVRRSGAKTYSMTLVTNQSPSSLAVVARNWSEGLANPEVESLGVGWPSDVFSLSHVAIPFRMDDPLYGGAPGEFSPGIRLGNLALRGERGTLQVSSTVMLRQRWNPFYDYQEQRIHDFLLLK